ncbi:hypothetical protein [Mesorhizobium sp.]|uniref:hypothetical protein n=1 Tax=Mesorhizobium sp. TaxID=1871066 RepID=UPI00120905E4|nr:hypothetical protein [Mesorhizobium sp.]TIS88024.1 MAG: hypothetical protein E5W89_22710 [Mesorhizobium sp.]
MIPRHHDRLKIYTTLHELSIDMFPEDGCLHVYGVGEDGVTAFTEYGIQCLKQIIADEKAARSTALNSG